VMMLMVLTDISPCMSLCLPSSLSLLSIIIITISSGYSVTVALQLTVSTPTNRSQWQLQRWENGWYVQYCTVGHTFTYYHTFITSLQHIPSPTYHHTYNTYLPIFLFRWRSLPTPYLTPTSSPSLSSSLVEARWTYAKAASMDA
jgi:hypothetical protein